MKGEMEKLKEENSQLLVSWLYNIWMLIDVHVHVHLHAYNALY